MNDHLVAAALLLQYHDVGEPTQRIELSQKGVDGPYGVRWLRAAGFTGCGEGLHLMCMWVCT